MVKEKDAAAAYIDQSKYAYWVGGDGYVWRRPRGGKKGVGHMRAPGGPVVKREPGYLYYVDGAGKIGKSPMRRKKG